jgi:hypothetical protein
MEGNTMKKSVLVRDIAKIKHLNIRKEGGDRVIAVDIKVTGAHIRVGALAALTGNDEMDLSLSLWDPEGERRMRMIKPVHSEVELGGCRMKLGKGIALIGTAKKFAFEILAGYEAILDWQFSVSDASSSVTAQLASLVDEEVDVELEILQTELFDGQEAA